MFSCSRQRLARAQQASFARQWYSVVQLLRMPKDLAWCETRYVEELASGAEVGCLLVSRQMSLVRAGVYNLERDMSVLGTCGDGTGQLTRAGWRSIIAARWPEETRCA